MIVTAEYIKKTCKLPSRYDRLTHMVYIPQTAGDYRKDEVALGNLIGKMNEFCKSHFGKCPDTWVYFYITWDLGNIYYFSSLEDATLFDMVWG